MTEKKDILERKDIPKKDTWDIESLFKDLDEWEKDYNKAKKKADEFLEYKGKSTSNSKVLYNVLKDRDKLYRIVQNLYSYASMNLDQDTRDGKSQALSDRALGLVVEVNEKTSFLIPEILSLESLKLDKYYENESGLKLYKQAIDDIIRQKNHVLSVREESILAQIGEVADSPEKIFSMLNNADLKFPIIKDDEGKNIEITHGNFIPLMESKNRDVRKAVFKALYSTYEEYKNTFAATLNGNLKNNIFNANIRNYDSNREASLDENNIELSVYDNLINSVHDNLDSMYKYMDIRKRALGVDELHMYDLYTPITDDLDFKVPYEKALELIKEGLTPLGDEYMEVIEEGLNSRWIDKYENRGKRSGAYSGGTYDSKPFILLNYHNTLDNVFTIAHEMGHSIHSYFTRNNQPFVYGGYSIFIAEVASTVNESILMNHMLKTAENKKEKLYLLNHYLESFRTTLFRQTMFAEFEKIINEHLESGGALTADYLCDEYKKINVLYYGPNVVIDDEIGMEWARIPHFYYNYYVFQYATGYSAAIALSEQIIDQGKPAIDRYITFLKSGKSDYSLNVLEEAGIDMTTEEPVNNAMELFTKLVDEMDKLI